MGFFSSLFGSKKPKTEAKYKDQLAFLEVDIHNHLLPGIDDGSASVEQSLELISGLNALGLHKFICTPHIIEGVHPNTKESIGKAYEQLQRGLLQSSSNTRIFAAAEHMIDGNLQRLMEQNNLCVMPGGFVLIEMSYLSESKALFQTILDIQNLGYTPILAHPERYNYYHQNFEMYKQIKDAGCLLQLNLLSVSRYYGAHVKSAALTLVKSGMYDFAGTDLHHERHLAALKEVCAKYDIKELLKTCEIQNASLLNYM